MNDPSFGARPVGSAVTPCPYAHGFYIEIEMVDADNRPVAGAAYRITLPDGATAVKGTLDGEGRALVSGLTSKGQCRVSFPELDDDAWTDADV